MRKAIWFALVTLPLGACAGTPAALEPKAISTPVSPHGYLDHDALQALADTVPAPPLAGSDHALADEAASQALRRFENTNRWLLATSHAEVRPPLALQHFDCALGVQFTPDENLAPATARIFQNLFEDAEGVSTLVKLRAYRARPIGDDASREACQTVSPAGRASASYPSGSATVGAAYGAAMAMISPQDAQASQRIGNEISISRAICGMHYPLDVQTGMELGQTVFEQARLSPAFQNDLLEARAEILRLKAAGKTSPACAAERLALSQSARLK